MSESYSSHVDAITDATRQILDVSISPLGFSNLKKVTSGGCILVEKDDVQKEEMPVI